MLMLIKKVLRNLIVFLDFNTSHVNVNRHARLLSIICGSYFNTSHVNVNLHGNIGVTTATANFNTSHVNVNLEYPEKGAVDYRISIHLMLMLIIKQMNIKADINDFNTSHVNVNLCDIFFLACQ